MQIKIDNQKLMQIVLLTILFMTGLWAADVGASAMILQASGVDVIVKTLLTENNPAFHYHLGLMLCLISFVCMVYLCFIAKDSKEKKKGKPFEFKIKFKGGRTLEVNRK